MALIISSTVIMVAALITLGISSGSLGDYRQNTDNIQAQGCDYQIQQAQEDPSYTEHMSSNCKQKYQQRQEEKSFVGNTIEQLGG